MSVHVVTLNPRLVSISGTTGGFNGVFLLLSASCAVSLGVTPAFASALESGSVIATGPSLFVSTFTVQPQINNAVNRDASATISFPFMTAFSSLTVSLFVH